MKRFIELLCMIFVTSCTPNIQLPNDTNCDVIFGHHNDWDIISDDLARNIYRHNQICENQS